MRTFNKDYNLGKQVEKIVYKFLKNNTTFKGIKVKDPYYFCDLIDNENKRIIEIKYRTYDKNQLNYWMFGEDKYLRYKKFIKKEKYKDYDFVLINCFKNKKDYDYTIVNNILEQEETGWFKNQYVRSDRIKRDVKKNYYYIHKKYFKDLELY